MLSRPLLLRTFLSRISINSILRLDHVLLYPEFLYMISVCCDLRSILQTHEFTLLTKNQSLSLWSLKKRNMP